MHIWGVKNESWLTLIDDEIAHDENAGVAAVDVVAAVSVFAVDTQTHPRDQLEHSLRDDRNWSVIHLHTHKHNHTAKQLEHF